MREHRGLSIAIAIVAVVFFVSLPFLVATTIWLTLTVYAIVKSAGSAPEQADPAAVLIAIVAIVASFALVIAALVSLLGRPMTPRRHRRGSRELPTYDT